LLRNIKVLGLKLLQNTTLSQAQNLLKPLTCNQLLEKTRVLQRKLLVNDKVQAANNLRKPKIA